MRVPVVDAAVLSGKRSRSGDAATMRLAEMDEKPSKC